MMRDQWIRLLQGALALLCMAALAVATVYVLAVAVAAACLALFALVPILLAVLLSQIVSALGDLRARRRPS